MDIFESLEQLNVSEECFEDILNIVEEYITESNRARKYGQKNLTKDSKIIDVVGTKALKDSTQMNPKRSSINLINRARSYDLGSEPHEGDHDTGFNTLDDPDTKKAFKNKEAIQGAIKSLKQAHPDIAIGKSLHDLKVRAREISRRKDPEENKDVLADNGRGLVAGIRDTKANYKNVMNSLNKHHGYNRLEKEIKDKNKKTER